MSARAAWRLEMLGFSDVYRYVSGKADWLACGLPSEGSATAEQRVGGLMHRDVPTCSPGTRVSEISGDLCVVVNEHGIVLGDLRGKALHAPPDTLVEEAMNPAPSTYRPNVKLVEMAEQMDEHNAQRVLISDADGRLLGLVQRDDVKHAIHSAHAGGPVLASKQH